MVYLFRRRRPKRVWGDTIVDEFDALDELAKFTASLANQPVPQISQLEQLLAEYDKNESSKLATTTNPRTKNNQSDDNSSTLPSSLSPATRACRSNDQNVVVSAYHGPDTDTIKHFFRKMKSVYQGAYPKIVSIFLSNIERYQNRQIDQLALTSLLNQLFKDSNMMDDFFALIMNEQSEGSLTESFLTGPQKGPPNANTSHASSANVANETSRQVSQQQQQQQWFGEDLGSLNSNAGLTDKRSDLFVSSSSSSQTSSQQQAGIMSPQEYLVSVCRTKNENSAPIVQEFLSVVKAKLGVDLFSVFLDEIQSLIFLVANKRVAFIPKKLALIKSILFRFNNLHTQFDMLFRILDQPPMEPNISLSNLNILPSKPSMNDLAPTTMSTTTATASSFNNKNNNSHNNNAFQFNPNFQNNNRGPPNNNMTQGIKVSQNNLNVDMNRTGSNNNNNNANFQSKSSSSLLSSTASVNASVPSQQQAPFSAPPTSFLQQQQRQIQQQMQQQMQSQLGMTQMPSASSNASDNGNNENQKGKDVGALSSSQQQPQQPPQTQQTQPPQTQQPTQQQIQPPPQQQTEECQPQNEVTGLAEGAVDVTELSPTKRSRLET